MKVDITIALRVTIPLTLTVHVPDDWDPNDDDALEVGDVSEIVDATTPRLNTVSRSQAREALDADDAFEEFDRLVTAAVIEERKR